METANSTDLARTALAIAVEMYERNYPQERVTKSLQSQLLTKINDLIAGGMTDSEFLASFSINRVRHRVRN